MRVFRHFLVNISASATAVTGSLALVLLLIFSSLFSPTAIFAAEKPEVQQYQQKLDRLQQSIARIKEHLQGTRSRHGNIMTDLKQLEEKISENVKNLRTINADVRRLGKRTVDLKIELTQLNRALGKQRLALGEQLRAAYAQGRQQHIKMLLNQQNPAEAGRIEVYFDYLNRARQQQITQFISSIERQQSLEIELETSLTRSRAAQAEQSRHKRQLENQRYQRNQLLATLETDIRNQEQTLTELESSRNKIENLLMSLGELLADIPANPDDKQAFGNQKGRLPWPVKGSFLAKYGAAKSQGDMKWKGVLIAADYGTPVQAISHGRVAFSDWLQGFGFITIIDHGDGYMSLYGHNESLFKQAGDWVSAGEVIATTGDSGGQPRPGLYFEIRSRGKPVNPNSWCTLKASQPAAS